MLAALALIWSLQGSSVFAQTMPLTYAPDCVVKAVAARMKVALSDDKPLPQLFLESDTPLAQFQDAVQGQWKFRPEAFLNAFVPALNHIYLLDEERFYKPRQRFIDDSLAHELTHYIQVVYKDEPLEGNDEYLESEAIQVQTWFRETFMYTGHSPCAGEVLQTVF